MELWILLLEYLFLLASVDKLASGKLKCIFTRFNIMPLHSLSVHNIKIFVNCCCQIYLKISCNTCNKSNVFVINPSPINNSKKNIIYNGKFKYMISEVYQQNTFKWFNIKSRTSKTVLLAVIDDDDDDDDQGCGNTMPDLSHFNEN